MAYPVANPMESFMQGFQGMSNVIDQRKRTKLVEDEFAMRKSEYDRQIRRQQMQDAAVSIRARMLDENGDYDPGRINNLIKDPTVGRAIGGLLRSELGFDGDIEALVPDADGSFVVHVRQKDGTVGPLVRFADDDDPSNDEVARLTPDEVPQLVLGSIAVYDPQGYQSIVQGIQTQADARDQTSDLQRYNEGFGAPQPSLGAAAPAPTAQALPPSNVAPTAGGLGAADPAATTPRQQATPPAAQQPTASNGTDMIPPQQLAQFRNAVDEAEARDAYLKQLDESFVGRGMRAIGDSVARETARLNDFARLPYTAATGLAWVRDPATGRLVRRNETEGFSYTPTMDGLQTGRSSEPTTVPPEDVKLPRNISFASAAPQPETQQTQPTQRQPSFDPEGADYDYNTARANGLGPAASGENAGHWGSVAPASAEQKQRHGLPAESYVLLKGRNHETWGKAVAAEEARGFEVKKFGDRYFSVPKQQAPTQQPQRKSIRQAQAEARSSVIVPPNTMTAEEKDKMYKSLGRLIARGKMTPEAARDSIDRAMGRRKVKETVTIGDDIVALDEYGNEMFRYVGGALNSKDRASIEYSRSLARYYQSGGKAGSSSGTDVKFGDRMKFLKSAQDLLGVKPDKNPDAASWLVNGIADASARGLIDIGNPEVALGQIGNAYNAAMGARKDPWFGDPERLNQGANLTQILLNLQFSANSDDWQNILPPERELQMAESTGFARADVHQAVVEAAIALQQERGMDKNSALALAKQSVMDSVRRYAQGGGQ